MTSKETKHGQDSAWRWLKNSIGHLEQIRTTCERGKRCVYLWEFPEDSQPAMSKAH